MTPIVSNALLILISCLLSAIFTIYVTRRNNAEASELIKSQSLSLLDRVQEQLNQEFEQYRPLISRSMTLAANAGAQAKKVQAFEREVMRAVQDDLPITPEMIRAFSPKLGDMVDENPELLIKGRDILQKVLGGGVQLNTNNASRPHPFGMKEE